MGSGLKSLLRNKKLLWIIGGAILLMLLLTVALRKKPVFVKVQELTPGELRVIVNATTTSTVKSEFEVTLSAQRTGRVIQLPVQEGDRVKKGQLIARLDLTEEEVQSQSALKQTKATYDEAERNLKRSEELFTKGMIAQQDLDAAHRTYAIAKSQYQAATSDLSVRKNYSTIEAPFSGVISKKYAEVGELLLPGKQIVTMVDPDSIYVLATIDEVDVGRLMIGQPVTITIDAFPGEKFDGSVSRISPIVSGGKLETRTADVWVYFKKNDLRIKPGMSADVEILIATLQNVLSVPSQAIVDRDGKRQVYIANQHALKPGDRAKVTLRPVEIGESNWSFTEIKRGVTAGEFIVTTPEAEGLRSGSTIEVEKDKTLR